AVLGPQLDLEEIAPVGDQGIVGLLAEEIVGPSRRLAQPASLNGSLLRSKRDRKIAASIGSSKQYRTYAGHRSSTYRSNLPTYERRKSIIALSSMSCRRGS